MGRWRATLDASPPGQQLPATDFTGVSFWDPLGLDPVAPPPLLPQPRMNLATPGSAADFLLWITDGDRSDFLRLQQVRADGSPGVWSAQRALERIISRRQIASATV